MQCSVVQMGTPSLGEGSAGPVSCWWPAGGPPVVGDVHRGVTRWLSSVSQLESEAVALMTCGRCSQPSRPTIIRCDSLKDSVETGCRAVRSGQAGSLLRLRCDDTASIGLEEGPGHLSDDQRADQTRRRPVQERYHYANDDAARHTPDLINRRVLFNRMTHLRYSRNRSRGNGNSSYSRCPALDAVRQRADSK